MSIIVRFDVEGFIHKGYTRGIDGARDEMRDTNIHTMTLIEDSELKEIMRFLIDHTLPDYEDVYMVVIKGYVEPFYITCKIMVDNVDQIIEMFDLDYKPFVVGPNVYELLKDEIKISKMKQDLELIEELKILEISSYVKYIQTGLEESYLDAQKYHFGDYTFYDFKFLLLCMEYLWRYLYLRSMKISEIGITKLIYNYVTFNLAEFVNLNNEVLCISFVPILEDFTFIKSNMLSLIFNENNKYKIEKLMEDIGFDMYYDNDEGNDENNNSSDEDNDSNNDYSKSYNLCGIFISNKQWNKYKKYEDQWNENWGTEGDPHMRIDGTLRITRHSD